MQRTFVLVGTSEGWRDPSVVVEKTHVDEEGRVVLDWSEADATGAYRPSGDVGATPDIPSGLAFDSACRLFRSVPAEGRVERWRWRSDPGPSGLPAPVDLFRARGTGVGGDFSAAADGVPLAEPRGLAVDGSNRLFIAEAAARRILVYDLASGTLLRRVDTSPARPLDVAASGERVLVVLDDGSYLLELTARGTVVRRPVEPALDAPARIALSACGCTFAVLCRSGTQDAFTALLEPDAAGDGFRVARRLPTPYGRDLELGSEELVVARGAGEPLHRWHVASGQSMAPLRARGYDGGGIVRTPEGRVAFWTATGLRNPVIAPVVYAARGRVTTAALDGGEFQRVWSRLFLDACLPRGTELRVACRTSDEPDPATALPARPELRPVLERPTGSEIPWANLRPTEGGERTFETAVAAPAGRYLWVTVELAGNTRVSPALRAVRAELPAHDLLRRLPRTFSREPRAADFLHRYLAGLDGLLLELETRAALRHVLLDPCATPEDALPWLASFVGLLLDERWSATAKRNAVAEAAWLFRFRGTVAGLRRFLEIGLEARVILIEHFKLRGQGASLLGGGGREFTTSVLGGGFRIGGAIGTDETTRPLGGTLDQELVSHAHRFTVIVPASLDADRIGIARWILALHRPAHTVFDLCTADSGMRVGRGLHIGLSAVVGRTSGFAPLRLGPTEDGPWDATLGRGAILGRASPGTRPESSRLGIGTEVG